MGIPDPWVIRYHEQKKPGEQKNFAGFKQDGGPSYAFKFEKIKKYPTAREAMEEAIQLSEQGYVWEVKRICLALNEQFYFI